MDLPQQLSPMVRQALSAAAGNERVLWAAQPQAKRQWRAFGIWIMAIPWTVFALFWESMAILPWLGSTKTPSAITWTFGIVFPIFGLPFILIGFWMLYQPIRAMRAASSTVHALTERRLMTIVVGKATEVKSVFVDRIGPIERTMGQDGWGNLRIQTHSRVDSEGDRTTERFEMMGIPDVAALERKIIDLQPDTTTTRGDPTNG